MAEVFVHGALWKRCVNHIYLFCFTTFINSGLCFLSDHPLPIYYIYLLKCCFEHNLIIYSYIYFLCNFQFCKSTKACFVSCKYSHCTPIPLLRVQRVKYIQNYLFLKSLKLYAVGDICQFCTCWFPTLKCNSLL